jgi:hypothetical protein
MSSQPAPTCSLCSRPIEGGADEEWRLTFTAWSNWEHRVTRFVFHRDCYEQGKMPLAQQLASGKLVMGGELRGDPKDVGWALSNETEAIRFVMNQRDAELGEWFKRRAGDLLAVPLLAVVGGALSGVGGKSWLDAVPGVVGGLAWGLIALVRPGILSHLVGSACFGALIGWFQDKPGGLPGALGGAGVMVALLVISQVVDKAGAWAKEKFGW